MPTDPAYDNEAMSALIRAYIACRLAVDALPDLPQDIREVVNEPIRTLCHTVGPELERIDPGFFDRARRGGDVTD